MGTGAGCCTSTRTVAVVQTGAAVDGGVEVLSGLQPGDVLTTAAGK